MGEVKIKEAAEHLDRLLRVRGMSRENYSIGMGTNELHVYAKCAEREWGCAKPSKVEDFNVEWHWDIGPILAHSTGERA